VTEQPQIEQANNKNNHRHGDQPSKPRLICANHHWTSIKLENFNGFLLFKLMGSCAKTSLDAIQDYKRRINTLDENKPDKGPETANKI
jgi:hypothetical protein